MNKRLNKYDDYWFDSIVGFFWSYALTASIGTLLFKSYQLPFISIFLIVLFIFCLLIFFLDDSYQELKTDLTRNQNLEVINKSFDELKWNVKIQNKELVLADDNFYILKFIEIRIFPMSKKIYFNFRYAPNIKTGRLLFYLGICTFLKYKFLMTLNKKIKEY
jgi:hypothetical protein